MPKKTVLSAIFLFPVTLLAIIVVIPFNAEKWIVQVPTIILGKVIEIQPTQNSTLDDNSARGSVFPHSTAKLIVLKIIKKMNLIDYLYQSC